MSQTQPETPSPIAIRPLVTREEMERVLSQQRSITSEEFYRQVEAHLGRPMQLSRKLSFVNGRWALVDC